MNFLFSPVRLVAQFRLFAALAGLFVAPAVWATDPLFYNNSPVTYTIPGTPPPQVDARTFFNDAGGTFTINNDTYSATTPFYEPLNTLFYTNTGTMIVNGVLTTNGLTLNNLFQISFGCGFKFDQETSSRNLWSDTFYNSGNIHCVSTLDGNDVFAFDLILGGQIFALRSIGECVIAATNIANPGVIDVSGDGLIQMTGNNVDLTGGQLIQDPPLTVAGFLGGVSLSSVGAVGINTNIPWDPGIYLGNNFAESSFFPISPYILDLTNSTSYYDVRQISTNYNVYRYVFLLDQSVNVTPSVFIDDPNTINLGFEPGAAHIQWAANYTDDSSGAPVQSYLYLTDDYLFGASTNDLVLNGLPENFSFLSSQVPLLVNPTPAGFAPLPDLYISNNYAVFNGTLTASTANTNVSAGNPHGTITNIPGQIFITASNELNLAFTTISGANYLNLSCTNQFDGSPGASIAMPFSDISLGVTNGWLTVSNVLTAQIPAWSGNIQAFSTVFDTVDSTGTTNEYRVLIVNSALQPTATPWIKSTYLHGTNLIISDHLNVYGSFYSDAQSMTLNTNQAGAGATSLDGELFWDNSATFNANAGVSGQQMPNLLWVTNSGLMSFAGGANFGSTLSVTPPVPAAYATGTLLRVGTNVVYKDRVNIGTNIYMFVKALTNSTPNQVLWASSGDASLSNLVAAINASAGSGSKYSTATMANPSVTAGAVTNHEFTVTARTAGPLTLATGFTPATLSSNLTWLNPFLSNGSYYIPGSTNSAFLNHSLVSDQGTTIWATYFENDGNIQCGGGSFFLQTAEGILTNGSITASGDVILVATNTAAPDFSGLVLSNLFIQAGHKLTLWSPNIFGDWVTNNNNVFTVGALSGGGTADSGFNIPVKPQTGNLLGTTVTNISPYNKTIYNVWAGQNYGISTAGYNNNLALGHLVLDVLTTNSNPAQVFNGASSNNALYVDLLELKDGATHGNTTNNYNFPWLKINTNMFIYYARAIEDFGSTNYDVSQAIDGQSQIGANGGRLRWISSYAGYYSTTNYYFTNSMGMVFTNSANLALAQSSTIDSDSDGLPNSKDPTPFFVPQQVNLMVIPTNVPPMSIRVQWTTIPNATNIICYATNLASPMWWPFTNFQNWYYGNNVPVHNPALNSFRSPQAYIKNQSLPDNSQETNVWVIDVMTNTPRYYKVQVQPNVNFVP